MTGVAEHDGAVRLADPAEASNVYAKGYFGTPEKGGGLSLDRYDAVYLCEMERISVAGPDGRPIAWPALFRLAARVDPEFGVRYLVYRDLRQRGYVVRTSPPPVAFTVLPRGGVLNKTPSRFWIAALSERAPFDLARLFELADRARSSKKTLLLGVVDEESDLTYYRVRRPSPNGALFGTPLGTPTEGRLNHDRVIVHDPAAVEELGRVLAYGSRVGSRLELSLIEAAFLVETHQLRLRNVTTERLITPTAFLRQARRLDPLFRERLAAYRDLRGRGLVVKTGFKYGAHFRAYPRNPEHAHARYLVRASPDRHVTAWPEISGGVRVAQGVRKEFLLAGVRPDDSVRYLELERIRP
ncbi:MAG: tRNA-intron lyase [Thermoplasmata archaeon]